MPESTMKQKQQRPNSDIIMEAGRRLLTEVEKSTVSDSNKHLSMLLARSRSLDILSSPSSLTSPEKTLVHDNNDDASSVANSDDSSNSSGKCTGSLKDDTSVNSSPSSSQKKELKSELNNNSPSENYRSSSSRSSSISTSSSRSSNYSSSGKPSHSKLQRRPSSTTEGGATAFQEVALKKPIRITGYLEKRSKVLGWKKFWFVLDGRLLTYYKSKADYESLSACCGCINLGIASTVRPIQIRGCKGYPLQIVTRSQVYYLRSPEKPVLEQWLLAIQEAASSPPSSSALTSWNSCLGSQYFRNSFASQSQWSLNNSTEDVTDISGRLGNLPDTFYQRRDQGSLIYPSHPAYSQPAPIVHKCHSFASLQTPVINSVGGLYGRRALISSTENLHDLQEVQRSSRVKSSTMQHSTSLLVLDSSPQAAELRKELTRKLSVGSNASTKADQNESDAVPTPKFLLLSAKKKIQSDEESHHYDEIGDFVVGKKHYENCSEENVINEPNNKRNSRGESAEKDSNIYEQVDAVDSPPVILDSGMPSPVVWEPINDPCCNNINKRFPPHRLREASNRNSLVSISEVPEDMSSISPSPSKTPVLSSIPESSWRSGVEPYKSYGKTYSEDDLSSCRSESFRSLPCAEKVSKKRKGKAAIGGFFAKVFGKNKGKGSKSDSLESSQRPMIISGPIDLKKEMQEIPARRPPPSYKYNKSVNSDSPPVEKREEQPKSSPTIPGSRMTINNSNVMDELKQKVGHITLKRTNSRNSSGSDSEISPPKEVLKTSENPLIAARVPYVPRNVAASTVEPSKPTPVLILEAQPEKSESNTDDDILLTLTEKEKEVQITSITISTDNESPCPEKITPQLSSIVTVGKEVKETVEIATPPPILPPKSAKLDEVTIMCARLPSTENRIDMNSETEVDFQNKLAKFNRLSQRLSANFIAALQPSHTNQLFSSMNRSNSCKKSRGKNGDDALPPLPPKKKNAAGLISASTGAIPMYDVPSNNRPVPFKRPQNSNGNLNSRKISEEKSIAEYIRDLTKKNSTPDIVLSGNGSKSACLRDVMTDAKELRRTLDGNGSSDENLDLHKSNSSIGPGKPPKPKPPAKPKSLEFGSNRIKRSSESSVSSEASMTDLSLNTPTPTVATKSIIQMSGLTNSSPTTSNKSLNIDSLDVLSDAGLSDTKVNDSPPDSPNSKTCPMHPEVKLLHDDLGFSTDARTPESTTSCSDKIVPDSLATTPDTEIILSSPTQYFQELGLDSDVEPLSINKLEIVIRDNDGSPGLVINSPVESRVDSLERRPFKSVSVTPSNSDSFPSGIYQNLKFATVNTLIQEFETVEENEDEMSELYDDFPSEFYTPTPSSFSGYSPSDASSTTSDSSPISLPSGMKKHARIDAIRNSGMEQLEAFLNHRITPSSDDCSFESCMDSFSEEGSKSSETPTTPVSYHLNNNNGKGSSLHSSSNESSGSVTGNGINRTGAISRLGHSSAVGHLQKILTSDGK